MNKTELAKAVAQNTGLTQTQAKSAVDATLQAIADALVANDKIALIGFGTFSVVEKAARTGFNPRTQEAIDIPARKSVKFKAGTELTARIK